MCKIILTRGIQGSGKSTWAKNWVKENPEQRVRWNNDDVRNMFGKYWVPSRENTKVLDLMKETFIKRFMSCNFDIVIDDMNLNPKTVDKIVSIMDEQNKILNLNYIFEYKDFFISVDECIRRDSLRPNPIGEKVIKETWRKYRSMIVQSEQIKYSKQFLSDKIDINKDTCIVVDLDATVALNLNGRPFFGPGCAEGIPLDVPIPPTIHIVENFKGKVIFLTGRNESERLVTIDWINKYINVKDYILLMRHNGDFIPGTDFKTKVIKESILPFYNIEFILEDSDKVVKAFREMNLFVLQPINGIY